MRQSWKVTYEHNGHKLIAKAGIPTIKAAGRILDKLKVNPMYRNDSGWGITPYEENLPEREEMRLHEKACSCVGHTYHIKSQPVINRDYIYMDAMIPGDLVEADVVDDLMNALPPVSVSSLCAQPGEAWCQMIAPDGQTRPVYPTFKRVDAITFEYCGLCFRGENQPTGKEVPYV